MKTASTILSLLVTFTLSSLAQQLDPKPHHDVIGNLSVNGEVTQSVLAEWTPYTFELPVPKEALNTTNGFDIGFAVVSSVMEQMVALDSVRFTTCRYSVYHLDVSTGVETPVLRSNGTPMINIDVVKFADETTLETPTFFTTSFFAYNPLLGTTNSTNDASISVPIQNVGAIFSTRYKFTWGSTPDFTRPLLNQGYVVHFDIRFISTHLGVEYPEVKLKTGQNGDIRFVYKVVDMQMPELENIQFIYDPLPFSGNPNLHTEGLQLTMSSPYLEYFKLQRSADLQNWTDWSFSGEGDGWVGPFDVPTGLGGFYSNTYRWTLFDRDYPDERRRPQKEFYRMVWTGKKGVWKIATYP